MTEIEELRKKLNENLFDTIFSKSIQKEAKLRKVQYLIKLGGDENARAYGCGKSLLVVAEEMGEEDIAKFLKEEKKAEKIYPNEKEADKISEKFFDEKYNLHSVEGAKKLAKMGGNLGYSRWGIGNILEEFNVLEMNEILKDLPNGYVFRGNIDLSSKGLDELPDFSCIEVTGGFNCSGNNLTSLKGAPRKVGRWFDCRDNQLKTLEGAPVEVGDYFNCSYSSLETLKGAPREVGGDFKCEQNKLVDLKGGPRIVKGDFWCFSSGLLSLEGSPESVGRKFNVHSNKLVTLEGGPKEVNGDYWCYGNKLTTLKGAPRVVGRSFECMGNKLTTLSGGPESVGGDFNCEENWLVSLEGKPKVVGGKFRYNIRRGFSLDNSLGGDR